MNTFRCFLLSSAVAFAAPLLRLSETAIGPVSVAPGSNGPTRTVEMTNAGDGTLSVTFRSSVPWATASAGAPRACGIFGGSNNCTPINIALNTSSLAAGTYTAAITVSDPNAVDAPQVITVTVAVGGTVPDNVTLFVTPDAGSRDSARFVTNSVLQGAPSTSGGGNWLALAFEGSGSFAFTLPYAIVASNPGGIAEGSYNGTLRTTGSALAVDNKTVNVTMRVTAQPIMTVSPAALNLKSAVGGPEVVVNVAIGNRGRGTISILAPAVENPTPALAAANPWITAEAFPQFGVVQVKANPAALGAGLHTATVVVNSNGVNTGIRVPVTFEVSPRGAPFANAGGVLNNATFARGDTLGRGAIAAVFGEQFTNSAPVAATSLPLQQTLAGTRVLVNNQPAPVYFVSYGQINFQIPFDAAIGTATVVVESGGQRSNPVSVPIANNAPRLLRLGIGEYGIAVNSDQSFPLPRNSVSGVNVRPARAGETLVVYAIGLGPTTPGVANGAGSPQSPLAEVTAPRRPLMQIGTLAFGESDAVTPLFSGLTPGFVGLYQINVTLPQNVQRGPRVPMFLTMGNNIVSNTVELAIE
ncbi:MAG: hypothetical protein FJW30_16090 [Acidobacteria bacterium]|nr:hypothetical protein [Acidobacteriota bacterium]